MTFMIDHLIVVPILLPLVSAAVMLFMDERRRVLKGGFRSIIRLLEFTNDPAWLDQL